MLASLAKSHVSSFHIHCFSAKKLRQQAYSPIRRKGASHSNEASLLAALPAKQTSLYNTWLRVPDSTKFQHPSAPGPVYQESAVPLGW